MLYLNFKPCEKCNRTFTLCSACEHNKNIIQFLLEEKEHLQQKVNYLMSHHYKNDLDTFIERK